MDIKPLTIIAPALGAPGPSEAHVFAAAAGLWTYSVYYDRLPLHELPRLLLAPIQREQYILAMEPGDEVRRPVGFVAWANLSAEAESRYLTNPVTALQPPDWDSGDRMWFTDWFAPFGHSRALARAVRELLAASCVRHLYHRGNERGIRVMTFTGSLISRGQAKAWWHQRPMLAQMPPHEPGPICIARPSA